MDYVFLIIYGLAAIVWVYQFCNRDKSKTVVVMKHRFSALKRAIIISNIWSYILSVFLCFYFENWMFTTIVIASQIVAIWAWVSIFKRLNKCTEDSITVGRSWSDDVIALFQITTALFIFFMSAEKILSGH